VVEDLWAAGWRVSKNTVATIMAEEGLAARPKRRHRKGLTRADQRARRAPDLVGRDFSAPAPNVKWCGDFKQLDTDEGPLFLGSVEDLFSRRLFGFAMSERCLTAELAKAAMHMAVAVRGGDVAGVISTPTKEPNRPPTRSLRRARLSTSASRWDAQARRSTTRSLSRSSRASSSSCSANTASPPAPKPADASPAGSTSGITRADGTAPAECAHPSATNSRRPGGPSSMTEPSTLRGEAEMLVLPKVKSFDGQKTSAGSVCVQPVRWPRCPDDLEHL
jgi:hypothetical protein